MTELKAEELSAAAQRGEGYKHLTPGQAWNAVLLGIKVNQLSDPLPPHFLLVFDMAEQEQRANFSAPMDAPREMYNAAFNEAHPPYVRVPVINRLRAEVKSYFAGISLPGVGTPSYEHFSVAEIARIFDTTEGELLRLAQATGVPNRMHDPDGCK